MKECAYPLGGMRWLAAGLIALLVMALILAVVAYLDSRSGGLAEEVFYPRSLYPKGGLAGSNSARDRQIPGFIGSPNDPRVVAMRNVDTSYDSRSELEKYLAGLAVQEAWPYLLRIVAVFGLLVSMVVLGVRRLRRRHT